MVTGPDNAAVGRNPHTPFHLGREVESGETLTAREWARRLEVKYAPTIVLFDQEGREVIRSEAYFKAFHTQSILDYVGSGAYRTEPEFQRYLSDRADRIRSQGKDVDIWK